MAIAVVTGASRGLGRSVAEELASRGWSLIVDGRDGASLAEAEAAIRARLVDGASVVAVTGDVADPSHRRQLVNAALSLGGIDLVVNNASTLGTTPLPALGAYPVEELRRTVEVNVIAPLALVQQSLDALRHAPRPAVLNITSDASVEAYEGWGGYGLTKAALDHMSAVLAAEEPALRVWAVDPGDMRTQMHQDAFPGEDISDRPLPDEVAPHLVRFVEEAPPSGRYRLSDLRPAPELVLGSERS